MHEESSRMVLREAVRSKIHLEDPKAGTPYWKCR